MLSVSRRNISRRAIKEQGKLTYRLLSLPALHRRLVLLELVTPVRINLLIVVGLGGRRTSVRVHGDVVRAQEGTAEPAVVSTGVLLVHTDDHQTFLRGLDELVAAGTVLVRDLIPSLLLAVMVPPHLLVRQHLRHLHEATQVHRLAPRDNQFPFADAAVANVRRGVRHVLKKTAKNNKLKVTIIRAIKILSQTRSPRIFALTVSLFRNIPKLNFDSSASIFFFPFILFFIFVKVFRFAGRK